MKKILFALFSTLFLPALASADSTSSIQLPAGFSASVLSTATDTLSNLGGYITLILGVLLGVLVVEILIHTLRK